MCEQNKVNCEQAMAHIQSCNKIGLTSAQFVVVERKYCVSRDWLLDMAIVVFALSHQVDSFMTIFWRTHIAASTSAVRWNLRSLTLRAA